MAKPIHDWYLKQWLKKLGVSQQKVADLAGWQKSKVSRLASGATQYDRDTVNIVSMILKIRPFEVLMTPEEAISLRRLHGAALSIAAETQSSYSADVGAFE